MKDKSASVLLTVSVGGSKALIRAAISPLCMSAACQMKMEGIHAFVCACLLHTHKQAFNQLLYWAHFLIPLPSYSTCNYFLQRTQRKVLFTTCAFTWCCAVHVCGCCFYLCSISSSYWHLIFTHQFFSRWQNAADGRVAPPFANICPLYVAHVSAATLRCVECPPPSPPLTAEASHTNMQRHSEAHTQAETHRSAFFFSTCDLG